MPAAAGHRVDAAGRPAGAGHQRVDQRRLADAGVADEHADPAGAGASRSSSSGVLAVDHDVVDVERAVGLEQRLAATRGRTWSGTAAGRSPASYAATRHRSISRGRGSGSASAVTMTSWSALATMTRSNGSVSSAVRRSVDVRGSTRTIRARVSGVAGHVADQGDPVADDDAAPAQLARLHRDHLVRRRPGRCSGRGRR